MFKSDKRMEDRKKKRDITKKSGSFLSRAVNKFTSAWYALWLVTSLFCCWVCCHIVQLVPKADSDKKRKWCIFWAVFWFRVPIYLSPWIRIKNLSPKSEWNKLYDPVQKRGAMVLVNHTSFFDPFLFVYLCPVSVLQNFCCLLKAGLLKVPLFGTIATMCGHLPVYYNSEKTNNFSVDRTKMNDVNTKINSWLASGGGMCIYPEGQVAVDPTTLQTFRRGAFAYYLKYKPQLFGVTLTGVHHSWPKGAQIGGRPTSIEAKIFYVSDKLDTDDYSTMSNDVRLLMQQELDTMLKKDQ